MYRFNKKAFTLAELLVATAVLSILLIALFQLQATMTRSSELLRWKTQSQMKLRKFFKDYLIPDLRKASYPSEIQAGATIINGGNDPTDDMKLQYLTNGTGTNEIKISELANGTIIMKWQINHPKINLTNENASAQTMICTVRAYKKFNDFKNVLTYERIGNIDGMPQVDERVMLSDVEYVRISHQDKYTQTEINNMNTIPNSPTNAMLPLTDPDYFHTWQNSGTINIEIGLMQDHRVNVLLGKNRKFRTKEKISVKVNVQIISKTSIN